MKDGLKKTFEGLECISITVQLKALSTLPMAAFTMKLLIIINSKTKKLLIITVTLIFGGGIMT